MACGNASAPTWASVFTNKVWAIGAKKARVLPEPVWVEIRTSFPETMGGHALSWTVRGVGADIVEDWRLVRRVGWVMPMSCHWFLTSSAPPSVLSVVSSPEEVEERMALIFFSACSNVRNISFPSSSKRGGDRGSFFRFGFFAASSSFAMSLIDFLPRASSFADDRSENIPPDNDDDEDDDSDDFENDPFPPTGRGDTRLLLPLPSFLS
mmetsp:Transcript_24099/g.43225  ORF Transcript_24099/g.43225 Transcript_24099/m.43225 type:complete len:209 (-) Transcript_24099:1157-1783(-)